MSDIINIDVPPTSTVAELTSIVGSEVPSIPASSIHLYHNGRLLQDQSREVASYGIKDDDMLVLYVRESGGGGGGGGGSSSRQAAASQPQPQRRPGEVQGQSAWDAESIRLQALGNPAFQQSLRSTNRELFEAINDAALFRERFDELERNKRAAQEEKRREIQMLNDDPFNEEAQRRIFELIRQEQVMENLQSAIEHHPEVTFGNVTMLYINVEVNGVAVKAFVDSGAQATIMSPDCAQRCGIMRLIDSRFSGLAKGVGTARILGRVHTAPIKIGNIHLPCSFTVMEGKSVELLLGLDMLKRHQASIDLREGRLIIQGESVEFLPESEIPKYNYDGEEEEMGEATVEGPAGSRVDGRTGAVVAPPVRDTPANSAAPPVQAPPAQRYPEDDVKQLENLGFTRNQAIAALNATQGDVNMAASLLFN